MSQSGSASEVELIKNRLYQGGKIFPLWRMFLAAGLTGEFIFTGHENSTTIQLVDGKVKELTFKGPHIIITGMAGFNAFKKVMRKDATARFSIIVSDAEVVA